MQIESHLEHGTPVQVRLKKRLFDAIETWRRKQETIPSRPEAIRRLLCRSLVESGPKRKSTKRPTESETA
jgi:hypothetical protein